MVFIPDSPGASRQAREIRYCTRCFMPSSRPRIGFDEHGVCNACRYRDEKQSIDWQARKEELQQILEPYRSKDGSWDVVVPWSGGKDSSAIAHRIKFEYGMNPLLVTFSPLILNEVGEKNRDSLQRAGFDAIFVRPDQKTARRLARRFFVERGNPKVAWDAGINAAPVRAAMNYGIKIIFYAEHGESEYGGRVLHKDSAKIRDFTEVIEHQIGDDPRNWEDGEISAKNLQPYVYPSMQDIDAAQLKAYYFAYFHKWSMYENYEYIKDKIPFHTHPAGRTTGTFTDFDSLDDKIDPLYYYMQYVKFGFGRTIRDAARLIQNGVISREEGHEYIRKYDGEFPEEHIEEVLEYLDLTREQFTEIVDRHRNPEIWMQENGQWKLRYPVPEL